MARLVMILGDSGTGKSTSLRNLTAKDVSVVGVLGKELPFKTDIKVHRPNSYEQATSWLIGAKTPIVVLDDANYLMSNFEFATIDEQGYGKFARNAQGMVKLFNAIVAKESDQTYYILAHTEHNEEGQLQFKTTGKMVSEKYNPAGVTNIVLESAYDQESEDFVFRTKADGKGVKSPMGMFETPTVPNDLKAVHKTINEFYK